MSETRIYWDEGNGQSKMAVYLPGETTPITVKIPNGYTLYPPQGMLNQKTQKRIKPQAFYLEVGEPKRKHYFGRDILTSDVTRKIDMAKYNPDYMRLMFNATLAQLVRTKDIDPAEFGDAIVVSAAMPAQSFEDAQKRGEIERAYKSVFRPQKEAWYVRGQGFDTFRIATRFDNMYPEATVVACTVDHRGCDLVFVADLGYGTNDFVLYDPKNKKVLQAATLNNGLTSFLFKQVEDSEMAVEWQYLTNQGDLALLTSHFDKVEMNMTNVVRGITNKRVRFVLIGGTKLIPEKWKQDIRRTFKTVMFKDEFANVLAAGG